MRGEQGLWLRSMRLHGPPTEMTGLFGHAHVSVGRATATASFRPESRDRYAAAINKKPGTGGHAGHTL